MLLKWLEGILGWRHSDGDGAGQRGSGGVGLLLGQRLLRGSDWSGNRQCIGGPPGLLHEAVHWGSALGPEEVQVFTFSC